MCFVKQKEVKKTKKVFDVCSVLYSTIFKKFVTSIEQNNKITNLNDFNSNCSSVQI